VIGRDVTPTPFPPTGLPPTGGYEEADRGRGLLNAGMLLLAATAAIFVMGLALRKRE
jgi:hypothetical protein